MKSFFNAIGLFVSHSDNKPYQYNHEDYKLNKGARKIEAHKTFLKGLVDEENIRLTTIENKTSQLVAQTSIIFSLLGLFVPIFIDKVSDFSFGVKFLLLIALIFAFLFYLLTILNAIKNFNVRKFIYSQPSPRNVLNFQNKKLSEFYAEEVRDLLYGLYSNTGVNNKKASNLLHSYTCFKIANILTGLLVVVFSFMLLFISSKKESLIISEPIKIEHFDSVINNLTKMISEKRDTIYLKNSD